MPFVGCNLLLSQWVYIKTALQATSYEKGFYGFPVLSRGSWSEAQQRGSTVEAAQGDSSQFGEGGLVGSWSPPKVLKPGPRVQTAVRGARGQEVEGQRRGSAFFVEGCIVTTHHLSLPH